MVALLCTKVKAQVSIPGRSNVTKPGALPNLLTPEVLLGFSESCLAYKFDSRVKTPAFHLEMWKMCVSDNRYVAIAAPRSHAKSTAVTYVYALASLMFRTSNHLMIISDTEKQAADFLNQLSTEILENQRLRDMFSIGEVIKETETEFIAKFKDGVWFRILAKGSGQKIRGTTYQSVRPNLIIMDDCENEELVENKVRRTKFRAWFFAAVLPSLSRTGKIRMVGTILHFDSLLERLLVNKSWVSKRYAAHSDDFSFILWPEMWPKERLVEARNNYINEGTPELYSQEMLNRPLDFSRAFFKKEYIRTYDPMEIDLTGATYYIGMDLAISKGTNSDYTVFSVCAVTHDHKVYIVDIIRRRMDTVEIVEEMFALHNIYHPDMFIAEHGQISLAIMPVLEVEMQQRGVFLNLPDEKFVPSKDKEMRARPLQARMRTGNLLFNAQGDWLLDCMEEFLQFPKGKHDDQVDSVAWVCSIIDKVHRGKSQETLDHESQYDDYEEVRGTLPKEASQIICGY